MKEPCAICNHDLSQDEYIIAMYGRLFCSKCAFKWFTAKELTQYSEVITPQDIGLTKDEKLGDMLTLEQVLQHVPDYNLIEMFLSIKFGIVPATSTVRRFCRKINKLIDEGEMCIGPNYRKVYLPTLAKAINAELARRYVERILLEKAEIWYD